jgi:predicted permease
VSQNQVIFEAAAPVFLLILIGYALRRFGWLSPEADRTLLKLIIGVFTPCLIFHNIYGNQALRQWENIALAPLVGFGCVALGILTVYFIAPWLGMKDPKVRRAFAVTVGMQNYGYFPIPLVTMLFGSEVLGVLFSHNLGVEIAMWTVGVAVLSGSGALRNWRRFITPPMVTIVVTQSLNLWNPGPVPPIMDETIQLLGRCAIPIGILLIGATICDQFKEFQLFKNWGCILNACWLRLALIPAMALGLAALIPLSVELRQTLAVEMAMPSAVFPIILCRQYGADSVTAIRVAIGTSLVSWMTIPLWIPWGLKWLGVE